MANPNDEDVGCHCDVTETEVSSMELPLSEVVMVSGSKDVCIASNDIIAQESEEDDSCHWKAIVFATLIARVHILWQVRLVAFVRGFPGFRCRFLCRHRENICGLDIIAKATKFVESNVDTDVASDPIAVAVSLEEEIADGSEEKPSEGVLQLALQKELLWQRPEMEDAVATVPRFVKVPIEMLIGSRVLDGMSKGFAHQTAHFFGVYDGHGGSQVANYCRDHLHCALSEQIEFAKESNCGDSRAVLCRGKEPMALSVDHKPNREDEYERIEAAGGKVIQWNGHRVFGVLAMSRSIGDRYLKPWIIPEPEVTFVPRVKEDECLILASDGLWDVMTNKEACDLARRRILQWHKKRLQPRLQKGAKPSILRLKLQPNTYRTEPSKKEARTTSRYSWWTLKLKGNSRPCRRKWAIRWIAMLFEFDTMGRCIHCFVSFSVHGAYTKLANSGDNPTTVHGRKITGTLVCRFMGHHSCNFNRNHAQYCQTFSRLQDEVP
ncbi:putative protein phosphatase 2C 6 [Hibiscus syriacus]|uniref:protein-serine/threonine phosphatase n=1 Tax=Hibiscus syriacus TaxID=106335 RepID=A0A6A3D7R6_HIBSY|nr:putative protein phosphatase 2C 6 [Hibiscus syriacus]